MKRRQRKPVLDFNGDNDSPRRRWPANEGLSQNGSPNYPLPNIVGQYDSDGEGGYRARPKVSKLTDQVDDFLKEIQSIAPPKTDKSSDNSKMAHPGSYWQECTDEQTGYPYYWHTETNQVTWETPPELKAYLEKSQGSSGPSPSSNVSQWPPFNKYSEAQSNIPDGMIPKEVVARNRNRQAGIVNKSSKSQDKIGGLKSSHKTDDSSDDGKIEMITSFGNDESESEESDHDEPAPKKSLQSIPKKSSHKSIRPTSSYPTSVSNRTLEGEMRPQVGPSLPPSHYGPQNDERLGEKLAANTQSSKLHNSDNKSEEDILTKLKNQAKLLQNINSGDESRFSKAKDALISKYSHVSNEKDRGAKPAKDFRPSLVPGYEDDSDGEEDTNNRRVSAKPLFPIPETSTTLNERKQIETPSGKIRIYDYRKDDDSANKDEEKKVEVNQETDEKQEDTKTDLDTKANKFLESIDAPTKAFQRKRRIAFDVAPTKSKPPEPQTPEPAITEDTERSGFGFSKEEVADENSNSSLKADSSEVKKPAISFVKASTTSEEKNRNDASKTKEMTELEKAELRGLTESIMEKLRFLSEGSPAASAVQVMAIQIQTLMCAWEAGVLQVSYLRNWLTGTGCELTRLEQTAAPPGWECQWDRSHKRYYYRNSATGEAQWTYPQTDIAGGTEEMELCTTPPPPEHEEPPIIEMGSASSQPQQQQTQPQAKNGEVKRAEADEKQQSQQVPTVETSAPVPPPPPTISRRSPSPPPPPRINAEDLKRSSSRDGSEVTEEPHKNELKPSVPVSAVLIDAASKEGKPLRELIPPGIDSPGSGLPPPPPSQHAHQAHSAEALAAYALEAGVLYGAQPSTNPIYAATLAGAGIPLISHHPHPHHHHALMQGQLVHYASPAYHQHLHNQALVAARISGQEAVQFMMAAEYARVYENNQVIAKPPMKMPHESSLGSALNSFYSDIASMEKTTPDFERKEEFRPAEVVAAPVAPVLPQDSDAIHDPMKEKKKNKKLKTGIGKKQKEMSSMVAKWQMAQKNYKDTQ
ncbi:hypothetical protein QAD02_009094 [Eretmocerus hayati]|uniref:Uncharacterized protein n=1 Tax=Eretmocerus hayati TaxID=131215 RepID=A0ACC2N8N5_9HYME|nr:hypothetical protein QAD02_009094 [Eretmocerus hayati]